MPIKMTIKNSTAAPCGRRTGLSVMSGTLAATALAGTVLLSTGTSAVASVPIPDATQQTVTAHWDLALGLRSHRPHLHPQCWLCML